LSSKKAIICFVFKKIGEQEAEQVLPGRNRGREEGEGAGGRDGPNNLYTYE
jgi:hypothetical protein